MAHSESQGASAPTSPSTSEQLGSEQDQHTGTGPNEQPPHINGDADDNEDNGDDGNKKSGSVDLEMEVQDLIDRVSVLE